VNGQSSFRRLCGRAARFAVAQDAARDDPRLTTTGNRGNIGQRKDAAPEAPEKGGGHRCVFAHRIERPVRIEHVGYYYELARGLLEAGNQVTLFLVQNAVFAVRPSAETPKLRALVGSGVEILADDFALMERGIIKLLDGVKIAPIDIVVDHLEAGHKTFWH
jgi:hypothetical protein